jgi:transmembrane sensor
LAAREPTTEERRLAEAAAWRVRLSDAREATGEEFEQWLAGDPGNAQAFAEAEALWDVLGEHAAAPEMLAARRAALGRASRPPAPPLRVAATLAAALLATGALGYAGWRVLAPAAYGAAHGERRLVALSDGSRATLDSDSLLKVSYARDVRRLELVRGQARFDVAHDAARPFQVHAGDRTIVATGTSFEVERRGSTVLVVLIRGRVTVLPDHPVATAPGATRLVPGQRLTAGAANTTKVEAVDLDRVTAWETGRLVFDDEPLSEVVRKVSLYTARPVTVGDPAAGGLRISGVFRCGDLDTFVDTVARYLPVRAQDDGGQVVFRTIAAAGPAKAGTP